MIRNQKFVNEIKRRKVRLPKKERGQNQWGKLK